MYLVTNNYIKQRAWEFFREGKWGQQSPELFEDISSGALQEPAMYKGFKKYCRELLQVWKNVI